jgi:hypothetical protein
MAAQPWTVFGPFEVGRGVCRERRGRLWDSAADDDLCDAAGVYIIATSIGARVRIAYIGMTHEQGLSAELFSQRNEREVWPKALARRGRVKVWLFAKRHASRDRYAYTAKLKRQSHLLEQLLIMHARASGHDLVNTKKMKSAVGIAVHGLFGSRPRGRPAQSVLAIGEALQLR